MPSSLVLPVVLLLAATGELRVLERILAVVDGKPILLSDVRVTEAMKGVTRKQAVEALIDESLMLREAARSPQADAKPEELERAQEALVGHWPAGVGPAPTVAHPEAARRQVRILKYIEFRFRPQARVEDAAVREAYERDLQGREGGPGFEAARDGLKERLERRRLDEEVEAWVKELRSSAEIRYNALDEDAP
jgi:hypothetical protein